MHVQAIHIKETDTSLPGMEVKIKYSPSLPVKGMEKLGVGT